MKGPELGKLCRDTVSGWEGVATGKFEYMNGCIRWELAAKDKDGMPKSFVFDEQQIVYVAEVANVPEPWPHRRPLLPGGPIGTGGILRRKQRTGGPRDSSPPPR